MSLKEKILVLVVLIASVFSMLFVVFEINNTDNRVYLYSTIEVNNASIELYNSKIDTVNKVNVSIINEYNDCIKSVGEDTDLFGCGDKPKIKIFKKLNKIDINL